MDETGLDPALFGNDEVQYTGSRRLSTPRSDSPQEGSKVSSSKSGFDKNDNSDVDNTEASQDAGAMAAETLPSNGFATGHFHHEPLPRQQPDVGPPTTLDIAEGYGLATESREDVERGFSGAYQHASSVGGELWSRDRMTMLYPSDPAQRDSDWAEKFYAPWNPDTQHRAGSPSDDNDSIGPDASPISISISSGSHIGVTSELRKKSKPFQVWQDQKDSTRSEHDHRIPSAALRETTNLPPARQCSNATPAGERYRPQPPKAKPGYNLALDHPVRKRKATEDLARDGLQKQKLTHNELTAEPATGGGSGPQADDGVVYYTPASITGANGLALNAVPSGAPAAGGFNIMLGFFAPEAYNPEDVDAYIAYLSDVFVPAEQLRPQDRQYLPLAPVPNQQALNQRLTDCVLDDGSVPRMFREYPVPAPEDTSLFARCVRFAQSHAQQGIDWTVHPLHVDAFIYTL